MSALELPPALPPKTDHRWKDLVEGRIKFPAQMIAMKFMMMRISTSIRNDPSPDNLERCIDEVHEFFEKNPKLLLIDSSGFFA